MFFFLACFPTCKMRGKGLDGSGLPSPSTWLVRAQPPPSPPPASNPTAPPPQSGSSICCSWARGTSRRRQNEVKTSSPASAGRQMRSVLISQQTSGSFFIFLCNQSMCASSADSLLFRVQQMNFNPSQEVSKEAAPGHRDNEMRLW